jgi:hypothetical protein
MVEIKEDDRKEGGALPVYSSCDLRPNGSLEENLSNL